VVTRERRLDSQEREEGVSKRKGGGAAREKWRSKGKLAIKRKKLT
jgi:hypothetical protein